MNTNPQWFVEDEPPEEEEARNEAGIDLPQTSSWDPQECRLWWQMLRDYMLEKAEYSCGDCGASEEQADAEQDDGFILHIHHLDHNRFNNSDGNHIVLCDKCHVIRHRQARLNEESDVIMYSKAPEEKT